VKPLATVIEALFVEDEQGEQVFSGVVNFADGLSFQFSYYRSDGHVTLRRNKPDARWWPQKSVLTRVSSPQREAAIRRYVSDPS